jgi:hypothetical protein
MSDERKRVNPESQGNLLADLQKRALEAASQYDLPMSIEEIGSPQEVERRLRQAEQEGGQ